MHTDGQQLRLCLDLGISNQQPAEDFGLASNLQIPSEYCTNNQQRRGRRRRRRGGDVGSRRRISAGAGAGEAGAVSLAGLCWSINLAILIWLAHCTNAVPTDSSSISSSNNSSASSTIVTVAATPSSISVGGSTTESLLEQQQPQGQCLLDGLWVPETTVHCEKQASCRAIQRTGHCCPDYKCDCEKDGKTYANGYKLVDPDTPCTVCYCKGGEIVCSSVTCFRRDDCMPKYVPGRCCPEYDNCPILDNNPPLSSDASSSSSVAPPTTKPAPAAPPAGFNWNITIKEITKPTEIRITDDNHKVKQTFPTRKSPNTEAPPTATSTTTTTTIVVDSSTAATSPATAAAVETSTAATATATATTATDSPATKMQLTSLSQDNNPKALPVNGNDSLKLIASVGYIEHPLSHGSHVTVGQPLKSLVTYNADGLQPLAENDPSKVNIKREYTTEGAPWLLGKDGAVSVGAGSSLLQNGFRESFVDHVAAAAELEPDTAGSDNIYHIISTTEGPHSGSSSSSSTSISSNIPRSSSTEQPMSTEGVMHITEESSIYASNVTLELESTTEGILSSSSSSSSDMPMSSTAASVHHMDEDEVPQVESNPAYPSLPEDDFSLRDVNFPLVEMEEIVEAETKDEQRSIVGPFERDNIRRAKPVTESSIDASGNGSGAGSGGGSGDTEFYLSLGSTTEHVLIEAANVDKANTAKQQVPLMYSAEDSSAETRIQNVNELAKISARQTENETSAEVDLGSGQGELREPTTPRATRFQAVDIDELGSGAGQAQAQGTAQDPKADAESLKLNESQEQADDVAKTKATSRAEKSFVERTGAEATQHLERLYLQRIY